VTRDIMEDVLPAILEDLEDCTDQEAMAVLFAALNVYLKKADAHFTRLVDIIKARYPHWSGP
jgi:hypothetical protein